jgi:hypothetical protein
MLVGWISDYEEAILVKCRSTCQQIKESIKQHHNHLGTHLPQQIKKQMHK